MTPQQVANAPRAAEAVDALIRQWQHSGVRVQEIAADLARQIRARRPPAWQELPPVAALAEQYSVSHRTVGRRKQTLADAGLLRPDGNRYVVAQPAVEPGSARGARG